MSEFELETRPLFVIELFLDGGRTVLVAKRDVEITEEPEGYGVSYGASYGDQ